MPKPQTPSLFELDQPEETTPCSHILRVAFESGADQVFSYLCPDEIWPVQAGQRVEAPFGRGNKQQTGFCVQTQPLLPPAQDPEAAVLPFKLKAISAVVDTAPLLDATLLELAEYPFRLRAALPDTCAPGDSVDLRLHGVDLWQRTGQFVHLPGSG